MLTLYEHTESPSCQKVRLVLAEKQLPYQSIFVDLLAGDNLQQNFLALNPKAQVPVLVHKNGKQENVITESSIICDYLEDCFPEKPIFPEAPLNRVRARSWMLLTDTGLNVPHTAALTHTIVFRKQLLTVYDTAEKQAKHLASIGDLIKREVRKQMLELGFSAPYFLDALHAYDDMFQKMEAQLTNTDWLAGDKISIADIAIAPYIKRCLMIDLDEFLAPYPGVLEWYAAITKRNSWKSEIAAKDTSFVESFQSSSEGAWRRDIMPVWITQA